MAKTEDVTDAEFDESKEVKVPALSIEKARHELMKHTDKPYVKEAQANINLAQDMGLKNQELLDNLDLLSSDIDELTSSNNYYPINDDVLNRLFQIPKLSRKCFSYTKISLTKGFFKAWGRSSILTLMFFAWIPFMYEVIVQNNIITMAEWGVWFGLLIIAVGAISSWSFQSDNDLEYHELYVKLVKDKIEETKVKFPFHARKKLKEAMDTKIFKNYVISYPLVSFVEHSISLPKMPRIDTDPAIEGITENGNRYLICYWDVKKDIDKMEKQIKWIKNFKIDA